MAKLKPQNDAMPDAGALEAARQAFLSKGKPVEDSVYPDEPISKHDSSKTEPTTQDVSEIVEEKSEPEPRYSEVELQAINEGWVPQEQFKGDKSKWRDAQEWIDRTDLYKRIDRQGKEMQDLKRLNNEMIEILRSSHTEKIESDLNSLKQRKIEAIKNGDVESVEKIENAMHELQQKTMKPASKTGLPVEVDDFMTRNSDWFNESSTQNKKMYRYAIAIEDLYAKDHPEMSLTERLNMVEQDVKERFGVTEAKNVVSAEPKRGSVARNTGVPSFNNMPPEIKNIINRFVLNQEMKFKKIKDKSKLLTRDDYVKQLISTGFMDKHGNIK